MQTDHQLTTAHRDLLSLDHAISKLYERFGDLVDGNADYVDAEERRFAALDCLATIQASSPAGMTAKARAMQMQQVIEDPGRCNAIAASLASDVIRYLSRSA
jgi:hypothetical protein